ncbi:hypothetical protein J1N35_005144 [Gossypium stocksii]|uniref:Uncharacterized protein n=1 Tax=Gossypium stocksii TaxID=47602 RepID=A0A9D4AIC3_9ROSI|nr:hypothetical protein J1N35_005144 [Gossypium stocksii]
MGKGGASDKVMAKMLAEFERVVSTPKFKRRKVLAVRDFLPGYGRRTASNFELSRQITINQSSQSSGGQDFLWRIMRWMIVDLLMGRVMYSGP